MHIFIDFSFSLWQLYTYTAICIVEDPFLILVLYI